MTWETLALRVQLGFVVFVLVLSAGLLFLLSAESAQSYPELAHLQIPIYVAMLVGYIPVLAAIVLAFRSLKSLDEGTPLVAVVQQALPRLKMLTTGFIVYMVIFLVGSAAALGDMHPSQPFLWLVVEMAAVLLWTSLCLVDRHLRSRSQQIEVERAAVLSQ